MRDILSRALVLAPTADRELWLAFALGASSVATLLLYFYGVAELGLSVWLLLVPAAIVLGIITVWARRSRRRELFLRIVAGLWAGGLATLAYDLVRLPIAISGIPVFKAISYFGTIILGHSSPSITSEVVGWSYHLSNGIGFGLMYAAVVRTPRLWTAVAWGLFLELAMLLTPYAEVFGYTVSGPFLAITIGAHAVYGASLWAALRYWIRDGRFQAPRFSWMRTAFVFSFVLVGVGCVAADFHARHARTIPPSPPSYLGSHLYVTWNVPEPDRFAAMWIFSRFSDPKSRFHFIEPFSHAPYGTPFDIPEAKLRRTGTSSATEVLVESLERGHEAKLALLGRVGHVYEIAPWMRPTDPAAHELGRRILEAGDCGEQLTSKCLSRAFAFMDRWYQGGS